MEQQARQATAREEERQDVRQVSHSASQAIRRGWEALCRHRGVSARAGAVLLIAGAMGACGGSDDDTVRMTGSSDNTATKSPSDSAGATGSGAAGGDAQTALNGPIGVDAAQLVSPVSQAPVGRQTVQQAQRPAGQDINPPRHP
ncbi:hypothetical protein [Paracidovorax citrulli]